MRIRQPILDVLVHEGRTLVWLARRIERNPSYLSQSFNGHTPLTASVRAACAGVLGLPESELFHGAPDGAEEVSGTLAPA